MARGPIVTQELFDHVKEIMDEVPQKEKETLDHYAERLNGKYNKMRTLSADTYHRIRKSNSLEEYHDIIRKKHPLKSKQNNSQDDEFAQMVDHLQKALNIAIKISVRRSPDNDDDEYLQKIYEAFGRDNVQEVS